MCIWKFAGNSKNLTIKIFNLFLSSVYHILLNFQTKKGPNLKLCNLKEEHTSKDILFWWNLNKRETVVVFHKEILHQAKCWLHEHNATLVLHLIVVTLGDIKGRLLGQIFYINKLTSKFFKGKA